MNLTFGVHSKDPCSSLQERAIALPMTDVDRKLFMMLATNLLSLTFAKMIFKVCSANEK